LRERAPVYEDERVLMRQYTRCACGRVKAKRAKQCIRCYMVHRRKIDYLNQLGRGKS